MNSNMLCKCDFVISVSYNLAELIRKLTDENDVISAVVLLK